MQGRPDVSVALAGEALATEPGTRRSTLVRSRPVDQRRARSRAEADLKQMMTRFPNSAAVHTQMGMLLGRKRQLPAARTESNGLANPAGRGRSIGRTHRPGPRRKGLCGARTRIEARIASNPTAALLTLAARTYAAAGDLASTERSLRGRLSSMAILSPLTAPSAALPEAGQARLGPSRVRGLAERSPKSGAL